MVEGYAELTLETRSPGALEHFYTQAFGLEVLTRDGDRVWLAVGHRARLGL
jgi:catechol-2,3-dioxygenase